MSDKLVTIRSGTLDDAQRIGELAQAIAKRFIIAEFSGKGRSIYLKELSPEAMATRLADAQFRFLVAEHDDQLVGVAALQSNWHLYHLFVADGFQRGGLARRLWKILRDEVLASNPPKNFKASVPRYATAAYARMGFQADGNMRDEKGVRYLPMTCPVKRPKTLRDDSH